MDWVEEMTCFLIVITAATVVAARIGNAEYLLTVMTREMVVGTAVDLIGTPAFGAMVSSTRAAQM